MGSTTGTFLLGPYSVSRHNKLGNSQILSGKNRKENILVAQMSKGEPLMAIRNQKLIYLFEQKEQMDDF